MNEEVSTETEKEIKKLMNTSSKKERKKEKEEKEHCRNVDYSQDVKESLALMKQLSDQYDELERYIQLASEKNNKLDEPIPVDLITSFVKSTKISPSLIK